MAEVTVFVDDAVRGTLPAVCVKDGLPTSDRLRVRTPVGDGARLGVLWLLLLAGPIGWVAFFVLASSRSGAAELLSVELPMSDDAYQRVLAARRAGRTGWIVAVGGLVAVIASLGASVPSSGLLLLGGGLAILGGLVAAMVADARGRRASVGVTLDASRRWVTLRQVHPAFVAACQQQGQHQHQA